MKIRTAVVILLLVVFAFSTIAAIHIRPAKAVGGHVYGLPDAEMMLTAEFGVRWGPGTITGRTDVSEPGVQFDFTGLTSSDTGVGDDHPVAQQAGGALYSGHYSDFSAYTRYSMNFTNVGSDAVDVCLFMNTGFTSVDPENDTYWASETVALGVGQTKIVTLDFSSCYKIWNAEDDLQPTWQHPDGSGGWPVRRLNQVTNIGFQIYQGGGGGGGSIIVSELSATLLYTDPAHILKGTGDIDSFFDVCVTVEDYAHLAGFEIKLTWDPGLLTQTAVDYTTALDALWGSGNYMIANYTQGDGYYSLAAVLYIGTAPSNTGSDDLFEITFQVKGSNFDQSTPIHFEVATLLDDTEPMPLQLDTMVTDSMYYITETKPGLTLELIESDSQPFEEGKTFLVRVNLTNIYESSPLEDYDLTIAFDTSYGVTEFGMADYTGISWGVFAGTDSNTTGTPTSTINVLGGPGSAYGDKMTLCNLTFNVRYDASPEHVWKYLTNENRTFGIRVSACDLGTSLGSIDELDFPNVTVTVEFIRGDVNSDGLVQLGDLQAVAYYYGLIGTSIYDLSGDGVVDIFDVVAVATNYDYGA